MNNIQQPVTHTDMLIMLAFAVACGVYIIYNMWSRNN